MTGHATGILLAFSKRKFHGGDPMGNRYECHRCWRTSEQPESCCGAPMTRVVQDEGIFWPLMWLPVEVESA